MNELKLNCSEIQKGKKKSRWIGRDRREENVLIDEETPEDEKGRKKKMIEKILRVRNAYEDDYNERQKISAWKSEGKGWRYVILW